MNLLDPNIKKYVIKWKTAGEFGDLLDNGVFENEDGEVLGLVREQANSIRVFEHGMETVRYDSQLYFRYHQPRNILRVICRYRETGKRVDDLL